MDKKSIYLICGLILVLTASVYWGYRVFFIERDFIVESITTCDPKTESCFMSCDVGECDTEYYKKITKKAYTIPVCNEAIETCEPLICENGEPDCTIEYCSLDTAQEGEVCTNLADFESE